MELYTYNITDTLNNTVNLQCIDEAIKNSIIVTEYLGSSLNGNIKVFFDSELSPSDEGVLDSIIANHDGEQLTTEAIKESYRQRIIDGKEMNLDNTATIYVEVVDGNITLAEAEQFSSDANSVTSDLEHGWFSSAYNDLLLVTPPTSMLSFYNDFKQSLKDYVNTNYPASFHIT